MFTGIIESLGEIKDIITEGDNIHFVVESPIARESYIDQSISHNGVCLTVVDIKGDRYTVTAIKETLDVTNLKDWTIGTLVNLERSMKPDMRLDGHFVQGHVDTLIQCTKVEVLDGSWYFSFEISPSDKHLLVNKGSVSINGTSLTVIMPDHESLIFKVAIIPYTYEHTNFKTLKEGGSVNIEFDILGKYIARQLDARGL